MPRDAYERARPALDTGLEGGHEPTNDASVGERVALVLAAIAAFTLAGGLVGIGEHH